MVGKRPCQICREWFQPHARAGPRQRACGSAACQQERHRRACAKWREHHPDYDREERVRRRLEHPEATEGERSRGAVDPLEVIDWTEARRVVGLPTAVLVERAGELLVGWARDAVRRQVTSNQTVPG
jgi:hypothetical protein